MIIKDTFILERSETFQMSNRDEVTVNLSLKKVTQTPNTKILGKVLDECNDGIKGATVKILTLRYNPIEHTTTDSCGRFLFNNIIPAGIYYIIAAAPSFAVSKSYKVIVRDNSISRLIIKLNSEENTNSGIVYGFVQDGTMHRISNAIVKVFSCDNSSEPKALCHTNEDGEYLVYGLDTGKYSIIAEKPGYTFPNKTSFMIFDNEFTNANLILYSSASTSDGTITGQILYRNQKVPYALVALYSVLDGSSKLIKFTKCNEDGVYLFDNIKPGKYIVRSNKFEQIVDCH